MHLQGWRARALEFAFLTALAIAGVLACLWAGQPPAMSAAELHADGSRTSAALPWSFPENNVDRTLAVTLTLTHGQSARLRVIPDDELLSIRTPERDIPLESIPPAALRDWNTGFVFDFTPFLKHGENTLIFALRNHGGPGGMTLTPASRGATPVLLLLPLGLFLFALWRLFRLSRWQGAALICALAILLAYWNVTPWETRSHDVGLPGGHFGYISHIADTHSIPRPTDGWTFYHPPLYYVIGAAVLQGTDALHIPRPESMQILSLGFWLVFLAVAAACLRVALPEHPRWQTRATLALALWPSGIIHSIRIGNDVPTYAACALATWAMLHWWEKRSWNWLLGAAAAGALALLFKSSALAIPAAAGLLVLLGMAQARERGERLKLLAQGSALAFISIAGLLGSFGHNLYLYWRGVIPNWMIGNIAGLNNDLRVATTLKAFLPLDIPTFLTTPWISAWSDASGRQNFWNYLLRNSLSGEFSFAGRLQTGIALFWGYCLLALCLMGIYRGWQAATQPGFLGRMQRTAPLWAFSLMWLLSLIALRIQAPFSCSNDFRYIVPVLIPALALAIQAGKGTRILLLALAATSALFFAALSLWPV